MSPFAFEGQSHPSVVKDSRIRGKEKSLPIGGDGSVASWVLQQAKGLRSQAADNVIVGLAELLPIKMLNDRILVNIDMSEGERRSQGGHTHSGHRAGGEAARLGRGRGRRDPT